MEILNLVDKLEASVTKSTRVPATHKVMLDISQLLELVDQMRMAIPRDVQEAQELMSKRESLVNQAMLDARRIKASAQEESRSQVEQSKIVQEANQKAEEVLADAKRRADALLQDAQRRAHQVGQDAQSLHDGRVRESNRYAQEVLSRLEQQLSSVLNSVRMGLDNLEEQQRVKVS